METHAAGTVSVVGARAPGDGPDAVAPLMLDLLEWIGPHSRPYAEVLEAWRTSCPRLPVWEEVQSQGLVEPLRGPDALPHLRVSTAGRQRLASRRGTSWAFAGLP